MRDIESMVRTLKSSVRWIVQCGLLMLYHTGFESCKILNGYLQIRKGRSMLCRVEMSLPTSASFDRVFFNLTSCVLVTGFKPLLWDCVASF